jgi:hypothetical protein
MRRADRAKAAKLESILERHESREKQTLFELAQAGFKIQTIADARRRLTAQRKLAGFTQDQIDTAIRAAQNREI